MRAAMLDAPLGDDVYGDDPSVNRVTQKVAEWVGHEAALLVPSGTQSNLIALLTHCGRGDEYIVGQNYHTYYYESGGAASLGGIVPQPIAVEEAGHLDPAKIVQAIKPHDMHFARSRLLSLENTHLGKVIAPAYFDQVIPLAREHGLAVHLDGARIFNAAVALGIDVARLTRDADTVSICFSKGLGAPIGSMLCGSRDFIEQAKRWRKMVGGGMRQAGVLAAAMEYALDHHVERLAQDHENAKRLENALREIEELKVAPAQTNMVYVELSSLALGLSAASYLKSKGFLLTGGQRIRLVMHLDVASADLDSLVLHLKAFFRAQRR